MTEREQKQYMEIRKTDLVSAGNGFDRYIKVYGPNGNMPDIHFEHPEEYNDITIDVDEILNGMQFQDEAEKKAYTEKIHRELDETTIASIVLGACMKPERLNRNMTASTTVGDLVAANQMRLTSDVMNQDGRSKLFGSVMVIGRKEAKDAITDYILNRDDTKAKKALQTFVDYSISQTGWMVPAGPGNSNKTNCPENIAFLLGHDIIEKKTFGVAPDPKSDIDLARSESFTKQMRAVTAGETCKLNLIEHFDELGAEEKELLIGDMLFQGYIANMASAQQGNKLPGARGTQTFQICCDFFKKHGMDFEQDTGEGTFFYEEDVANIIYSSEIPNVLLKHSISDFDVLLAQPDGEKQLKDLYMESIKKSDIYKDLMGAQTKEEFMDQVQKSDKVVAKGITSIEGVTLPNVSKDLNARHKRSLDQELGKLEDNLLDFAFSLDGMAKKDADKYGFSSLDPEGVQKNAKAVGELYKLIDGNNTWGGSKNYKDMLTEMKKLKELSEKYAKTGMTLSAREADEYKTQMEKVEKLAENYLENKTDINSDYARKRVDGVKELRRALKANLRPLDEAIDRMKEEMRDKVCGDYHKTYRETDTWRCEDNAFYGEKYKDPELRKTRPYSTSRAAGITVSIFAMAATGKYTVEELMDNSKLREEKAAMYDKVLTCMQHSENPENQKWIAKQIYEGQKATEALIDKEIRTIDLSNPDIMQDKKFCQMLHLSFHQFDAWQEMSHCKDEIFALAKAEHPEMKRWEDYKEWWGERETKLSDINNQMDKQQSAAVEMVTQKDYLVAPASQLFSTSYLIQSTIGELARVQKEGTDKPFQEWISRDRNIEMHWIANMGVGMQQFGEKLGFLNKDPALCQSIAKGFADGTLVKNTTLRYDVHTGEAELSGFPTEKEIKNYAANAKFLQKTDQALQRLEAGQYKNEKDFVKDASYAVIGQMYRATGDAMLKGAGQGQTFTLDEFLAKQMKDKTFTNSLRSKNNPKKFIPPTEVAKMAKNEEQMRQTGEKYIQSRQRAPEKQVKRAPRQAQRDVQAERKM